MERKTVSMKNILCYGDSNTFGFTLHGGRHPYDVRWTGRLQLALGPAYRVIEEGCGGRTTVFEDPIDLGRNGRIDRGATLHQHLQRRPGSQRVGGGDRHARWLGGNGSVRSVRRQGCRR